MDTYYTINRTYDEYENEPYTVTMKKVTIIKHIVKNSEQNSKLIRISMIQGFMKYFKR